MKILFLSLIIILLCFRGMAQEGNAHINQINHKNQKYLSELQASHISNLILNDASSLQMAHNHSLSEINEAYLNALIAAMIDASIALENGGNLAITSSEFQKNGKTDSTFFYIKILENYINTSMYKMANDEDRKLLYQVSAVNLQRNNDIKEQSIDNQFGEFIDLIRFHEGSMKDVNGNISGVVANIIQLEDIDINELMQDMDSQELHDYVNKRNSGMTVITPRMQVRSNGNIIQIQK